MKITFLGTSSGKTSLKRFHSSLFITAGNYNLLVDAGDGISHALLANRINFNLIDGIIFTHLHPDHYSGLASLIVQMKMIGRSKRLEIFIHVNLAKVIEEFLIHSYLLKERMEFEINYKTFEDDVRSKIKEDFSFLARRNSHFNDIEKFKEGYPDLELYSASLLFEWREKKIIYTSDIGSEDDLLIFRNIPADVLISEATHIPVASLIEKLQCVSTGLTYITHYSDEDELKISEILARQSRFIQDRIIRAKDSLSFEL